MQANQTQLSFDALELPHGKVVVECSLETDDAYPPAYFRRYVPALYVQFEAALVPGDDQTQEVL